MISTIYANWLFCAKERLNVQFAHFWSFKVKSEEDTNQSRPQKDKDDEWRY